MLFTSLEFFVFLPLALLVFALLPRAARWPWLLAASWFFYGFTHPTHLVYLGAVTVVVWACGTALSRAQGDAARRSLLAVGLVLVLGSLVAFKFYDFAVGELERMAAGSGAEGGSGVALPRLGLTAPAGYSFYVFAAASFLIDSFSRRLPPGSTPVMLPFISRGSRRSSRVRSSVGRASCRNCRPGLRLRRNNWCSGRS